MRSVQDRLFLVYMHTSPKGKRYVGITSQSIFHRWGDGGKRYRRNAHFWNAICRYGWDNFEHTVIASDLDYESACKLEEDLIAKYNLTNPECGYNHTYGGEFNLPSEDVRVKLSNLQRSRWKNPEFREKVISGLRGHKVSQETREKISKANLGRKLTRPSPLRGRKLSDEHRAKLRGNTPWCKGLSKDTDSRLAKIADKQRGRVVSDISRKRLSDSLKQKYKNGYKPIWINNGVEETHIDISYQEIPAGYVKGRIVNYKYMYRGEESKRVPMASINDFLKEGWNFGRGNLTNLRKANQKCKWIYDGVEFRNASDLALYLNSHGYPKIVDSTITSLYKRGFDKSPTYSSLAGKILREDL